MHRRCDSSQQGCTRTHTHTPLCTVEHTGAAPQLMQCTVLGQYTQCTKLQQPLQPAHGVPLQLLLGNRREKVLLFCYGRWVQGRSHTVVAATSCLSTPHTTQKEAVQQKPLGGHAAPWVLGTRLNTSLLFALLVSAHIGAWGMARHRGTHTHAHTTPSVGWAYPRHTHTHTYHRHSSLADLTCSSSNVELQCCCCCRHTQKQTSKGMLRLQCR